MFDNQLELYIKNDEVTLEQVLNNLAENNWISDEYSIEGVSISFIGGDYDHNYQVSLYGDYILIEGDNSWEVVQLWEQLKSIAL